MQTPTYPACSPSTFKKSRMQPENHQIRNPLKKRPGNALAYAFYLAFFFASIKVYLATSRDLCRVP